MWENEWSDSNEIKNNCVNENKNDLDACLYKILFSIRTQK